MWVNKDFFIDLNSALESFTSGQFNEEMSKFERYKAKKYQKTIDLLGKFKTDQLAVSAELDEIILENYQRTMPSSGHATATLSKLLTLNHSLKTLADDLNDTGMALYRGDYDHLLPSRDNHRSIRDLFNRSLRNLCRHMNDLKETIIRQTSEIERLKRVDEKRAAYLEEVVPVICEMAEGNDTLEIPWCEENAALCAAIQEMKTVLRKVVRFLVDLSQGFPDIETVPFSSESQMGSTLLGLADTIRVLIQKMDQRDRHILLLEQEITDNTRFIELASYYLEGIVAGDHTRKPPFLERHSVMASALEQVRESFSDISSAILNLAEGKPKAEYTPRFHGPIQTAFKQLCLSIDSRQQQFSDMLKLKTEQFKEAQDQLKELLDYNLKFEKQYDELGSRHTQVLNDHQEQGRTLERLRMRNERLEEELKALKQNQAKQIPKISALESQCETLSSDLSRQELYVKNTLKELESEISRHLPAGEPSRDDPPDPLNRLNDIIFTALNAFDDSVYPITRDQIDLKTFFRNLQTGLAFEAFTKNRSVRFIISRTAPAQMTTDVRRFSRLLDLLLRLACKRSKADELACRIFHSHDESIVDLKQGALAIEVILQAINFPVGEDKKNDSHLDELAQRQPWHGFHGEWDRILIEALSQKIGGYFCFQSNPDQTEWYRLLIPLQPARTETVENRVAELLPQQTVFYLLEDDMSLVEAISGYFSQCQTVCISFDTTAELKVNMSERKPDAIFLGAKWGDPDQGEPLDFIFNPEDQQPFALVGLIEPHQAPEKWLQACVGFIGEKSQINDLERVGTRIQALHQYPPPHLGILDAKQQPNAHVHRLLTQYQLSASFIDPECMDTLYHHYTHLLVQEDPGPEGLDQLENLLKTCRREKPEIPIIAGVSSPGYSFRNRITSLVDALLDFAEVSPELLYETICLFRINRLKNAAERKRLLDDFHAVRHQLLKDCHALMVTKDADKTLNLRKQLNQYGITIRVNTQWKQIENALKNQKRCDVLILNAIADEAVLTSVIKQIHASSEFSQVPILLMGENPRLGDEEYWLKKGAHFFVPGKSELPDILSALRIALATQFVSSETALS